jgi:hypothetical protein
VNIKFLVKFNKTATEMLNLSCEAYGENILLRAHVWYKRFAVGRQDVKDDE